jgi:hypothetical protein
VFADGGEDVFEVELGMGLVGGDEGGVGLFEQSVQHPHDYNAALYCHRAREASAKDRGTSGALRCGADTGLAGRYVRRDAADGSFRKMGF